MNRRDGFTIVELIIVIVIMAILLVLAVVNLGSSQVGARDDERTTDIANIARALEQFYTSGTDGSTSTGFYPLTGFIASPTTDLRDIDPKSLRSPGNDDAGSNLILATTNSDETVAGAPQQPTIDQYIYQPLDSSGNVCTTESACRSFNLYYRLEADNTVHKVTSKNQ